MKDDKVDNKAVDNYLGKMVPPGFLPVAQMYLNQCHSSGKYMTHTVFAYSSRKKEGERAVLFFKVCKKNDSRVGIN